jgi:hypothetical protein
LIFRWRPGWALPRPGSLLIVAVVLGPYPLCALCREVNGGLVAVKHRQVHLRAYGKQSCVDAGLAGLITNLWAVCETLSCCEDDNGRAYVVPTADTHEAAEQLLVKLGLRPECEDGTIYFRVPTSIRLRDAELVRRALEQPASRVVRLQVDDAGRFKVR